MGTCVLMYFNFIVPKVGTRSFYLCGIKLNKGGMSMDWNIIIKMVIVTIVLLIVIRLFFGKDEYEDE